MATTTDQDIKRLYARLYDRSDIPLFRVGTIVITTVAALWLLCGAVNYLVLGRDMARQRDRAVLAFGYGPAFGPLRVAQSRTTVRVFDRRVPIRQGALLFGGGALALCLLPMFVGQEQQAQRERQRRVARKHAERQGRLPPTSGR